MEDLEMTTDWRTVQIFLVEDGPRKDLNESYLGTEIYSCEVEVDSDNKTNVRCTCKGFENRSRCKHTIYVKNSMKENNGHFNLTIPEEVPNEEVEEALDNAELFRQFVINHTKIEFLA